MGFVGNYAPRGLAPQIDDMPVIPKKAAGNLFPAAFVDCASLDIKGADGLLKGGDAA